VGLIAAGVAVLVDDGASPSRQDATRAQPPEKTAAPGGVTPALAAQFAVLRRPKRPDDAMPTRRSRPAVEAQTGVDLRLSRSMPTGSPAAKMWIAPWPAGACLFVLPRTLLGPAAGCFTTEQLAAGEGLYTLHYPDGGTDVFGVVPDGSRAVKLSFGDGSTRPLSVRENGYYAHVSRPTKSVSFQGSRGFVTVPADLRTG
jgi:hypothetical protein